MDYYKSLNHKIRAALTLSRGDLCILVAAWTWLLYIDLYLRLRPFPRVREFVERQPKSRRASPPGQAWEIIQRIQRLVIIAAHNHLYPMECLRQALTLKKMLGNRGIVTELRFGVQKTEEQFLAHAWLEYEGHSIELENERFTTLTNVKDRQ
jgi:hypothetical protein